jgi:hypothetical protein
MPQRPKQPVDPDGRTYSEENPMAETIPDAFRDLIDGPVFAVLTTLARGGRPQSSVMWCNAEDGYILINTTRERQKYTNMRRDPRVTLVAYDPKNPYRYIEIRGNVVEMDEAAGLEHINELARLYTGASEYYGHRAPAERRGLETRVKVKIEPTRVRTNPPTPK